MKVTSSCVVALLLSATSAIQMKSRAQFPTFPPGDVITKVAVAGLEQGSKELARELHSVESYEDWDKETNKPVKRTYEIGVRREIKNFNRDMSREMRAADVDFNAKNQYDPQFITDLIQHEYDDFVNHFKEGRKEIAQDLDRFFRQLEAGAKEMGLAQVETIIVKDALAQLQGKGPDHNAVEVCKDCGDKKEYRREPSCWDIGNEREDCKQEGECPGPCCWRGPKNDAEDAAFRKYWEARREKEQSARIQCFAKESKLVGEVLREIPSADEIYNMIKHLSQEASGALSDTRKVANVIRHINEGLLNEAKRVHLQRIPKMPDPQDTAKKIDIASGWFNNQIQDPTTRYGRDAKRSAGEFKYEVAKEIYRAERDLKRSPLGEIETPEQAAKALHEARREVERSDRDFEEASRMIKREADAVYPAADMKKFALDSIDTLIKLVTNPSLDQKVMDGPGRDVAREIEHEAADAARSIA